MALKLTYTQKGSPLIKNTTLGSSHLILVSSHSNDLVIIVINQVYSSSFYGTRLPFQPRTQRRRARIIRRWDGPNGSLLKSVMKPWKNPKNPQQMFLEVWKRILLDIFGSFLDNFRGFMKGFEGCDGRVI